MHSTAFLLIFSWCFCFAVSSIMVKPQNATVSLGGSLILRCTYSENMNIVQWYFQIENSNPLPVSPEKENACDKLNKTVNGDHVIYRESDEICVLEVSNLRENITYRCYSGSDDQQDKAVILVIEPEPTTETTPESDKTMLEIFGIVAAVAIPILLLVIVILLIVWRYRHNQRLKKGNRRKRTGRNGTAKKSSNSKETEHQNGVDGRTPINTIYLPSTPLLSHQPKDDCPKVVVLNKPSISPEDQQEIDYLTSNFLDFKDGTVFIHLGNLSVLLRDIIANDAIAYVVTNGVNKFQALSYYTDRLNLGTADDTDCDTTLINLKNRDIFNKQQSGRLAGFNAFYDDRLIKFTSEFDNAQSIIGANKSQNEDKYRRREAIIKLLKQISEVTLNGISSFESNALEVLDVRKSSKCACHNQRHNLMKLKRFRGLICEHWTKWNILFQSFPSKISIDGKNYDDEKSVYEVVIREEFKNATEELKKSCICFLNAEDKVKDSVELRSSVENTGEIYRPHTRGANSSMKQTTGGAARYPSGKSLSGSTKKSPKSVSSDQSESEDFGDCTDGGKAATDSDVDVADGVSNPIDCSEYPEPTEASTSIENGHRLVENGDNDKCHLPSPSASCEIGAISVPSLISASDKLDADSVPAIILAPGVNSNSVSAHSPASGEDVISLTAPVLDVHQKTSGDIRLPGPMGNLNFEESGNNLPLDLIESDTDAENASEENMLVPKDETDYDVPI